MKKELRKHQSEACAIIENNCEGIIHLPTGSGNCLGRKLVIINYIINCTITINKTKKNSDTKLIIIIFTYI